MFLPACLVTSSPTFEEPKRTPPFLLTESAIPDIRLIKVVDTSGGPPPIEFSAGVMSEDAGEKLWGRLVLDYGIRPGPGDQHPYFEPLQDPVFIPPATLDDGARTLSTHWFVASHKVAGCHNVTLFATHEFDLATTGCPTDSSDFDYLTWTIIGCDSSQGPCCDPTVPADEGGCTLDCPDFDPKVNCTTAQEGTP